MGVVVVYGHRWQFQNPSRILLLPFLTVKMCAVLRLVFASIWNIKSRWKCPWCNGYCRRKWTRRHELKSLTRLFAFYIALIPLRKVWIQLFSLQLCVNSSHLIQLILFFFNVVHLLYTAGSQNNMCIFYLLGHVCALFLYVYYVYTKRFYVCKWAYLVLLFSVSILLNSLRQMMGLDACRLD